MHNIGARCSTEDGDSIYILIPFDSLIVALCIATDMTEMFYFRLAVGIILALLISNLFLYKRYIYIV